MRKYCQKSRSVLSLSVAAAVASLTAATSSSVFAQQSEDIQLEEVVVTGSRIAGDPNATGSQPVQSLNAEDIAISGEFSISDLVNDIPALFSSSTSENSIDGNNADDDGANILNLRGLGAARTLVLVDGRRHVAGSAGTQAVDVGSIPMQLIERVEVLTGGASAVYGADAVTGVVNFVLKDDYEGFDVDLMSGISGEGDANQTSVSAIWGNNFSNGRGNIAVAVDYRTDEGLEAGERGADGVLIGSGRDWVNPDLRFQQGDISGDTPNFAQYFNYANTGLTDFGLPIPSQEQFIADYQSEFGMAPAITAAEEALFSQAANAPQRAVEVGRTFPFTSGYGYIIPGNPYSFGGFDPAVDIDLDGNGRGDCLDSFTGYNSSFGAASFGVVGGCWNVGADGSYAPVQDGRVAGNFQGFGGDSFNTIQQPRGYIITPEDKATINLIGHFDVNERMTAFGEVKYSWQENENVEAPTSYWDLLFGDKDNPFLPAFIQPLAQELGGVAITVDPIGLGPSTRTTERETYRIVGGLEGSFANGWTYEVSANYGRFEQRIERSNEVIFDRYLAAIDAVTDEGSGEATCRSSVDPTAPLTTTPFDIPVVDPGYFSFTPGDGQCVPLNIWAGQTGITPEAVDFVTRSTTTQTTIEQTVFSGFIAGDTEDWFSLPAGPIAFATGLEYRKEESALEWDSYARGVLPAGSPFGEGTNISDVSDNAQLLFQPSLANINETGDYDATDIFLEVSVPLLEGAPFAESLVIDAAVRGSDYSTIGEAFTWKTGLSWAPVEDIRFRATFAEAVRAPNINELFAPTTGTTFRPNDPCDAAQLTAIAGEDPALAAQIQANCVADFSAIGLNPVDGSGNYTFADPLSAAFPGTEGGNDQLQEETAETLTVGLVFQPTFLEGLTVSVDYWQIEIEDAIEAVSAQDIVDACYRGSTLNEAFCGSFTRNGDSGSAQFGGFNFLEQSLVNFAALESDGIDFSAGYDFSIGEHGFGVTVAGTYVNELNRFSDPLDSSVVDVELGEINRPELAGNIFLNWYWKDLQVQWQTQYQDEQLYAYLEIETAETLYGPSVVQDEFWQHDIAVTYAFKETMSVYGGVRNVTDEEPFITNFGYPASPRGQFFYLGLNMSFGGF
ncbi:TonB-dependent receptor domain-containing protein [Congregibacter sp.]|uniref:TonB-dependent receptor domain-containing protein n=1 Tax=Congregibacter sp. TaxID=2744308 RepID=UPI003F6BDE78